MTDAASMITGGDIDMVILGLGIESKEGGGGFVASDRAKVAKQLSRLVRPGSPTVSITVSFRPARLPAYRRQPLPGHIALARAECVSPAVSPSALFCSAYLISQKRSIGARPATAPSLKNENSETARWARPPPGQGAKEGESRAAKLAAPHRQGARAHHQVP